MPGTGNCIAINGEERYWLYGPTATLQRWNPLTSDTDAFMLVDNLAVVDIEFTLERCFMIEFRGYAWFACFKDSPGRDLDRRRAIVLAALKAVSGPGEKSGGEA